MTPEDRVSFTMELQEDVSAKFDTIKQSIALEQDLLPQGNMILYRVAQVKLHFLVLGLGGTPLGLGHPFFVRTTSIDP